MIAQFHQNCLPDSGFGSGGAVLLDVNPFVVNAPPRAVRINSISRYLNAQAQPRLVVAGGVRYGLDAGAAGACFIAMFTTEGTLDPNFDFDGIRIYDPRYKAAETLPAISIPWFKSGNPRMPELPPSRTGNASARAARFMRQLQYGSHPAEACLRIGRTTIASAR